MQTHRKLRHSSALRYSAVIFFLSIFFSSASAKIYTIQFGGVHGYTYQPNTLNVFLGDTIQWIGDFSTYALTSTSVPLGAESFGPANSGDTFSYVAKILGDYGFQDTKYTSLGMSGSFTVIEHHYGLSNDGREFYLGMLTPSYNYVANAEVLADFVVSALISTYYENEVTITYYDASGKETAPQLLHIPKEQSAEVFLSISAMQLDTVSDLPVYKACHITSKYPVTVYYKSIGACAGGSYLALPVISLGKNYVAASFNDNPGAGALYQNNGGNQWSPSTFDYAGGKFTVIATEDVTTVKITPAGQTASGHAASAPFTIQLNKGQCYQVRSDGTNSDNDLSGSIIESSKPIVVISGHENASLGGTDPYTMESRDFMIEQMIPVEYWDTTGYISIPVYEGSPPGNEGNGDSYRIYTFDANVNKVHLDVQGIGGGYDYSTIRLAHPPEKLEVNGPAEAYSTNGKKIALMQYDESSIPANQPWSSPSMITIVPVSRWKRNYSFYLDPKRYNYTEVAYISVIAQDLKKINVAKNGISGPLAGFSTVGGFNNFSGHYPGMQAGLYKIPDLGSISFFLSSPDPFMVYYYGFHNFSPHPSDLGNLKFYSNSNYISEFASPSGIQLYTGTTPSFTVDTQSTCSGWHICIRDTGNSDPGIKAVILIDDPDGIYWQTPAKFSNVSFDATSNDYAEGELHPHWHTNSAYCFDVNFASPLAAASAPLAIVDNLGNAIILRVDRTAPTVKLTTNPQTSTRADSIVFPVKQIGTQICTTFVLKNTAPKNGTPINVNSVQLSNGDTSYKANTSNITFPHSIAAGDSVSFQVCYTPIDSSRHQDTLILKSDCFSIPISLDAHGSTGLISAGDLDFKTVYVGDTSCKVFQIKNVGSAPFTLTASYLNSDTLNFTVNSKLPAIINPGSYANITICFHPQAVQTYTDSVIWNTDLESAFKHSLKDHSQLSGQGIQKAGVKISTQENSFTIRPNPANGNSVIITVAPAFSRSGTAESRPYLIVFDVLGREMYKREIPTGTSQIQIPIQNLPEGTYYMQLSSENGTVTQSFMKVR